MNILFSFCIFLIFSIFQDIDINELKKDPKFIEVKKVMNEIKNGTISGRYKLPSDAPALQKELAKNPSKENMKGLYKKAGMANSDEYVDKLYLQSSLMIEFIKRHPELSKLNAKAKNEIVMKLFVN